MKLSLYLSFFCHIASVFSLPNFVIFLADDLGYGDVGCFGNHTIRTPNIDKLADNGLKLNHHLAAAAVCTPSRAALMTGRYPIRSGMESSNRNKVFFFAAGSGGLPENETTFAKALKKKKYSTAIIGKWHLGNNCNRKDDGCHHPLNHGFDIFYGLPLSNFKDLGDDGESVITTYLPNFFSYAMLIPILGITLSIYASKQNTCFFITLVVVTVFLPSMILLFLFNLKTINGILMDNMEVVEQPIRLKGLTQRFVAKAESFLDKAKDTTPFLLYVSFVHVHTALFCSDEFSGRSRHGEYGDNVEELDWAVGKIMDKLEELGVRNNTFVYFSSDNGAHVEEVGADGAREGGFNGVLRGGKMMGGLEGGIRVPTIISWHGSTVKGEINATTSQMDVFPTILELAQTPLPLDRVIDGHSLVPLLKGELASPHQFLFHYCGKKIHAATYLQEMKVWKVHWTTPKFLPGTSRCEYVCHCFGYFVVHHDPPLLFDITTDLSEMQPINATNNPQYYDIVSKAEKARDDHYTKLDMVPDQFSFSNTVWKPWLQPCCSFPFCRCRDTNFPS